MIVNQAGCELNSILVFFEIISVNSAQPCQEFKKESPAPLFKFDSSAVGCNILICMINSTRVFVVLTNKENLRNNSKVGLENNLIHWNFCLNIPVSSLHRWLWSYIITIGYYINWVVIFPPFDCNIIGCYGSVVPFTLLELTNLPFLFLSVAVSFLEQCQKLLLFATKN